MFKYILPIASLIFSGPLYAAPKNINIYYVEPENPVEAQIKQDIQQSGINDILTDLSSKYFPFNKSLTIEYGRRQGPLYDPDIHTVYMPYQFYQQTLAYFKKNKYDEQYGVTAKKGAIDTLLHTLLHEAGHAYIADQNIPILGQEENAVDHFAAIMMIDHVENGADSAISAADLFVFESKEMPEFYDLGEYLHDHGFELQRYFSTLCLVYGSDPQKYPHLLDEVEEQYLAERKDFCLFQYNNISYNWHTYLKTETRTLK